jgi:protein-ribulosamine 3-kinase
MSQKLRPRRSLVVTGILPRNGLSRYELSLRSARKWRIFRQQTCKATPHPSPNPGGCLEPSVWIPETDLLGAIEQPNNYSSSWADFFANQRLRAVLQAVQKKNETELSLAKLVERTASIIVPYLLHEGRLGGETGISPVVVHGDLWSGNHGRGSIGKGAIEEVVFDPSACYAHS